MDFVQDIAFANCSFFEDGKFWHREGGQWRKIPFNNVDYAGRLYFSSEASVLVYHEWGRGLRVSNLKTAKTNSKRISGIERVAISDSNQCRIFLTGRFDGIVELNSELEQVGVYNQRQPYGKVLIDGSILLADFGSHWQAIDLLTKSPLFMVESEPGILSMARVGPYLCYTEIGRNELVVFCIVNQVTKKLTLPCFSVELLSHGDGERYCSFVMIEKGDRNVIATLDTVEMTIQELHAFPRGSFSVCENYSAVVPYRRFVESRNYEASVERFRRESNQ